VWLTSDFFCIISCHRLWEIAICKPYYHFLDKELHGTYSLDGDHQQRSGRRIMHDRLERQVQTLVAVVERLTKQNNDLEEQLRQKNAGHNIQEED